MAKPENPKPTKPLTRSAKRIIDVGLEIGEHPPNAEDAAFMARELVLCTLPHRNPGELPVWTRRNGNLTLAIQPGWDLEAGQSYGFPYGSIPRLILYWIITEAVRNKSPVLELGDSLSTFIEAVGLSTYTGRGKRGDAKRLMEQMRRLLHARISFHRHSVSQGQQRHQWQYLDIGASGDEAVWWSAGAPQQRTLWASRFELGAQFFQAITSSPVPVDVRALRSLKRSPLALDLYGWLCLEAFKAHKSGKGRFVSWPKLIEQIGTEYSDPKNFGRSAREALKKIAVVYPDLALGSLRAGVRIEPNSLPAVLPKMITLSG